MSDYDYRPEGSLKLKSVADGRIIKKKKRSSKLKKKEKTDKARARLQESRVEDGDEVQIPSGSGRGSPAAGGNHKTEAEKRFEEVQRERLAQKVAKMANKTHKDRVIEFNAKLEALSEHHDIPKVGPG